MLKDKRELEQYLEKRILNFLSDTELCNKICNYANEKYDLPRSVTSDYVSLRNPLEEANEFILFCILDSIEHVKEEKKIGRADVVTAVELSAEQKAKVEQKLLDTTKYETFEMNYSVDSSLIGGMVIRIGDRVVDSSIKTKLFELTRELRKVQI